MFFPIEFVKVERSYFGRDIGAGLINFIGNAVVVAAVGAGVLALAKNSSSSGKAVEIAKVVGGALGLLGKIGAVAGAIGLAVYAHGLKGAFNH